jgi:hypothetical protein
LTKCPYPGCNEAMAVFDAPLKMVCQTTQQPIRYFCRVRGCWKPLMADRRCSSGHLNYPPEPTARVDEHCHCPKCGIDIPDKPNHCPSCGQGFEYHCPFNGIDLIPTAQVCNATTRVHPTDPVCNNTFLSLCPQYPTP